MNAISVRKENNRYVATIAGREGEAELVFSRRAPGVVSADHAEAPMHLRGTGAALALVEAMVQDARANGFRILPRCPYVAWQAQRHPEWADVMAG
ncbi:MAG: N-acetyltransferase [Hyphomicrobiales bacterium]|nr:N-acetyltransferase [Hyphomicrobiales bacterium]